MSEPDFISQTAEPMTPEQRQEWFRWRVTEAENEGATFHRYSHHPGNPDILLHEGWKVRPDDQGEPRFQFTPTEEVGGQRPAPVTNGER